MSSETALSRWLRDEMPRRGYALDGPRAGGISRLAQDTGISQATMSRVVGGLQEPTVNILRRIGDLWGIPLGQMMVNSGLAEPEEMVTHYGSAQMSASSSMSATAEAIPAQPDDLPKDVNWPEQSELQKYLWRAPTDLDMRKAWLHMLEVIERHSAPGGGAAVHPIEARNRKYV